MDIFNVLTMIGGLCLFLFGMTVMGQALERRASSKLRSLLGKLTNGRIVGLLTGMGVTAVIQSSSATTVMVVGFVNSGLMTLRQAINVIMGANIGTTVTAWLLSLAGIDSGNVFIKFLKPSSFTPILAVIGVIFYIFCKNSKKKDSGMILLGFATLMFGMETMSSAVSVLGDIPDFRELFLLFQNPILGVVAGTLLTAIIQSSSASVGILQALALTGRISYGAAIPIIMGQNIGTCVTALLSSVGATKNAKRAALVHLSFNLIGTLVWLTVFCIAKAALRPLILDAAASSFGIAIAHSAFNLLCTLLMLPLTPVLEKLVTKLIPDSKSDEKQPGPSTAITALDERLLATPPIALERCRSVAAELARRSVDVLNDGINSLGSCTPELAAKIRQNEDLTDRYEDMLGTYLVHLSNRPISAGDSTESAKLLKVIGDFERIADHGVNILESAEEMASKGVVFTESAAAEIGRISAAVREILELTLTAFLEDSPTVAEQVEPLGQVIGILKEKLRTSHILRLQQGECSINAGFIWSDLLTDFERTSDHCSNIAGCIIDLAHQNMNLHESLRDFRNGSERYASLFSGYAERYLQSAPEKQPIPHR